MAIQTISEPSAAEQQVVLYNTRMRRSNIETLTPSGKYAIVLLKLAPAVTPANYAAIGQAINAITGIQGVTLLIDGQAPASIPEGKQLNMVVDAHLRIDAAPEA